MKHIRLYLFVLFTACSMFMVCPFAHAESMDSDVALHLDEIFNSYPRNDSYNNLYNEAKSYCPYYLLGYYTSPGANYSYLVLLMSSSDNICFAWSNRSGGNFPPDGYDAGFAFSSVQSSLSSGNRYYVFLMHPSLVSSSTAAREISQSNSVSSVGGLYRPSSYSNQRPTYGGSWSIYGDFTLTNLERYGAISYSKNPSGNYIPLTTDNEYSPIVYTDDERLKLYKLWSSQNGDSLVVDLSAFRSYTPAAAYEFSNIVLTLTTNGVDIDYNLPLSSSTINNGWDNNSNLYTLSTPVSDFILSDTYDTYITKVSFSLDVSSPGGSGSTSFYISSNFPLDVHHSSITPGVAPTPALENPTIKFDSEISTIIGELNNKSSSTNNGQFDYSLSYNVPSWCDKYQETLYRFSDNSSSSVAGQFVDKIPYENGTITNYHVIDIYDYISSLIDTYDNSYDVFVFPVDVWYVSDVVTAPNYTDNGISYYIIFYTTRYFQRQSSLTDIDILYVLQKDANNFVDFVEYLQVRLDDFENKSLEILNPLYDETTYIDDKLASILYAVNNIESYNDSSIVSLLTDIKGLLSNPANEIDTPQECILLYEAHPNYFNELWGTPTSALRSASVTPRPNNPFISSDYVRADLVPAWWEGKTLTMIYILKNDGETSRFYNDILNGLFDSYENLIESDNSFNTFIDSLFKTGYDYTDSFYGHFFDLDYNPEAWDGGFSENE